MVDQWYLRVPQIRRGASLLFWAELIGRPALATSEGTFSWGGLSFFLALAAAVGGGAIMWDRLGSRVELLEQRISQAGGAIQGPKGAPGEPGPAGPPGPKGDPGATTSVRALEDRVTALETELASLKRQKASAVAPANLAPSPAPAASAGLVKPASAKCLNLPPDQRSFKFVKLEIGNYLCDADDRPFLVFEDYKSGGGADFGVFRDGAKRVRCYQGVACEFETAGVLAGTAKIELGDSYGRSWSRDSIPINVIVDASR